MLETIGVLALIALGPVFLAFLAMAVVLICADDSDVTAGLVATCVGTSVLLLGILGGVFYLGLVLAQFLLSVPHI